MRLATISSAAGPRLHVLGRSGYVDIGEATRDPRLASLRSFLEAGRPAMDAARGLADRDGRQYGPGDFGPAVPTPERVLCLRLNYSDHAIESEVTVEGVGHIHNPGDGRGRRAARLAVAARPRLSAAALVASAG